MFGLFKKKTKSDILQKKYNDLMNQSYELSKSNRIESDKKRAEAEEINKEIEVLDQN
jgi:hypothetical protein